MQTNPKRMEEIRHFLDELRLLQANIGQLTGEALEKCQREWRELSASLHSRLKAAGYFRRDWLYLKYLSQQYIEVVLTPHAISIEPLNGCWLDTIYTGEICDQADYVDAIVLTLEKEEVCNG